MNNLQQEQTSTINRTKKNKKFKISLDILEFAIIIRTIKNEIDFFGTIYKNNKRGLSMDTKNFSERLKALRKQAGYSQESLSEVLGLSFMTVRRWETGKVTPRMDEIKRIAQALNVSEDELLNGKPSSNTWVLHVEMGDTKEDYVNMARLATQPISAIITDKDAGFLKIGGNYELWQDDNLFLKLVSDLTKLRSAVIANGVALGGIKN